MSDPQALQAAYEAFKQTTYWKSNGKINKGYGVNNPGEASQIDDYVNRIAQGGSPKPPQLQTEYGRNLVGIIDAGFVEVAPPEPIPPEPIPEPPTPTGAWPLPPLREPTIFCSPTGSSSASGSSESSPMSFDAAWKKAVAGDVVGCLPGVYDRPAESFYVSGKQGRPDAWFQIRSYGDGRASFKGQSGLDTYELFAVFNSCFIEWRDLDFDGSASGWKLNQAIHPNPQQGPVHHFVVAGCRSWQTGAAGVFCFSPAADYCTIVGNDVWRFGDGVGWASGISLNSQENAYWFDREPGFHHIVVGNRITGGIDMSDYVTDGNGIILDLAGDMAPTLIAGNLLYMNGGRGYITLKNRGRAYVVNNTVWKNGLDLRKEWMQIGAQYSDNEIWANNIAVGSTKAKPYWLMQEAMIGGFENAGFQGPPNTGFSPDYTADPRFAWVPSFSEGQAEQWKNPPKPWELPANAFRLDPDSPYLDVGADLMTLGGLDAAMKAQMAEWACVDMAGKQRGPTPSLGAYQV